MRGRNANAYSVPHAFTYRNSHRHGNSYTYRDSDGNNHTTSISYAYGNRDSDNYTKANANTKTAANAVPPADAVALVRS